MRALIQRVDRASVEVDGEFTGKIARGILVLLGVREGDSENELDWLVKKCSNLRIFEDDDGKMNLSVKDIGGDVLVVSQFTLYGDSRKGNRPSFNSAAKPEQADFYYEIFVEKISAEIGKQAATGKFGAHMKVDLLNNGPVTILLEKEAD